MINSATLNLNSTKICSTIWQILFVSLLTLLGILAIYSQEKTVTEPNENTVIIEEVKDGEIFAFGKTVIIKKSAKGVLVFGGDVVVEGRIEEDVATIGGSIIQKNDAFIGGDVIVFGGKYQHERQEPLRNSGKETIMYAGYEEELRNLTQNPTQIFSPQFTWSYFAQRILSVLFWFLATLIFTTVAPGAVSRAVTRFQLSTLKVVGFGLLTFFVVTIFVITSFSYLPTNLSGIIGIFATLMILFAYFFGRVSLNVSLGKFLQKRLLPEKYQSESLAIFLGTLAWVAILSIPYLGNLAVVLLFAASLGLVITARSNGSWKSA
jgi:hypothetical protein